MKQEYILQINALLSDCDNIDMLDLVMQILVKSNKQQNLLTKCV